MLTEEEAAALGNRLDELPCTDKEIADGLFDAAVDFHRGLLGTRRLSPFALT